jgi:uncharacterized cupin superfamily protein
VPEPGYTIAHLDDLERSGRWRLARRSLGLSSFGMNVVDIEPGTQIPEHHELDRDQEEVFLVLEGDATLVVDGERHPAPRGTFARVDPAVTRTVANDGEERVRLLIVSAPRTSGYEPMDWA